MNNTGQWIANCKVERVKRIARASIYVLTVGPPQPNQTQTLQSLMADGLVGLYRVGKKDEKTSQRDQNQYLKSSDFLPSPESLKSMLNYMTIRS